MRLNWPMTFVTVGSSSVLRLDKIIYVSQPYSHKNFYKIKGFNNFIFKTFDNTLNKSGGKHG